MATTIEETIIDTAYKQYKRNAMSIKVSQEDYESLKKEKGYLLQQAVLLNGTEGFIFVYGD